MHSFSANYIFSNTPNMLNLDSKAFNFYNKIIF